MSADATDSAIPSGGAGVHGGEAAGVGVRTVAYNEISSRGLHLTFLAAVALLPFSTSVLADHYSTRAAIAVYWANLALLGVCIYASWLYASRAGLLRPEVDAAISRAVRRRVAVYQALYAGSALLCLMNPILSIAGLVLLQLNSAVAPRIRYLSSF